MIPERSIIHAKGKLILLLFICLFLALRWVSIGSTSQGFIHTSDVLGVSYCVNFSIHAKVNKMASVNVSI